MTKMRSSHIWHWRYAALASCVLFLASLVAISFGPIHLPFFGAMRTLLGLPGGLVGQERTVLLDLRLPRILLAALVGAALSSSGAVYQSVFRNPLADPYLLGAANGAGLGATLALTLHPNTALTPLFAFIGGVVAVLASFFISGKFFAEPATLLLSGIAIGSFFTAIQTYVLQRHSASLRPVYSWILGELTVSNWEILRWSSFYILFAIGVLVFVSRKLDGLMLSDEEAFSLGINPSRLRIIAIGAATLATATAVAAAGLIGFVGIVVPHLVRGLTRRVTNRSILTIAISGAAFLILADFGARTILSPAEVPIGIITAFIGAPFFLIVLRRRRVGG